VSDAPQGREVARRLFAAEFDDATLSYSEGDDERAPNYVVTPTGARVNRLFAVGALTEVEQVNEEIVRGRIADPTGVFVSYAGQYQPDAMNFLDRATPPCFVSLTGKARTYQPDDSDRIFTSVRPESLNEVDADTRDRWVVAAAEATLERVATTAAALELDVRGEDLTAALESRGVESALAQGVALAVDHYEPTEHYLEGIREMAVQALELVAGERDAVESPTAAPDDPGARELGPLPAVAAASAAPGDAAAAVSVDGEASPAEAATGEVTDGDAETAPAETAVDAGSETTAPAESGAGSAADDSDDAPTAASPGDPAGGGTSAEVEAGAQPTDVAAESDDASASDTDTPSDIASQSDTDSPSVGDEESESAVEDSASDAEPTTSSAEEPDSGLDESAAESPSEDRDDSASDDLGDFGTEADAASNDVGTEVDDASADAGAGIADDEMYELDEEERAEIEAEYGTEFETGNEVDEPGEADIDVPDVDELESEIEAEADDGGAPGDAGDDTAVGVDDEADEAPSASDAEASGEAVAADVDLEDAAVSVMADLDDGDGADREAVVASVVEEYGADPDDVAEAIQEALMSGMCYEPNEGTLKSI
jgi:RPA family protein